MSLAKNNDPGSITSHSKGDTKLCECGCGTVIKKWRHAGRELGYVEKRFALGHHARVLKCFRGCRHTDEARRKQSARAVLRGNNGNRNLTNYRTGIPLTEEHREKLRGPRHHTRGSGSHAWKGGNKDYRLNSADWKDLRGVILRRDNFRCQRCGLSVPPAKKRRLQIHHIVPYAQFGEGDGNPDDPSNLITLCPSCHTLSDYEWRKANANTANPC